MNPTNLFIPTVAIIEMKKLTKYRMKCEHNKRQDRCKECDGSEMCQHSRTRHRCKECHGSSICQHNIEQK